ncbi:MAG: carbamoyltransferase HypF [Bacteroidetes bacterium]|nr:carbamoyltransferase HypF [Bacteroidota bacterium]
MISRLIQVKGLVQGVGFRPFIYLLAESCGILGTVENRNDGVIIRAEGDKENMNQFLSSISEKAPLASNIFSISNKDEKYSGFVDFKIVKSVNTSNEITEISPDIAVCDECLKDIRKQKHRINYPFNNCTHCGPRFTIIKDLPYDREKTTMDIFPMCQTCKEEFINIRDRRFHAQPVACNQCGPNYQLDINNEQYSDIDTIISKASRLLDNGKILAIKGQGGYHLACDASNELAVSKLRQLKLREGKPFAVLFADLETLATYSVLTSTAKKELTSWQKPIVLLPSQNNLAPSVSNGLSTVGVMLAYMPIHYLLFGKLKTKAIVLTSGNIADEPIVIDNEIAKNQFGNLCDAILTYNRDIFNRTDDSVLFVANEKSRMIRRSRGFVPSPIYSKLAVDGIFAAGAELVNCFAIGKGEQVILSQHIGDLQNLETLEFYTETINQFSKLYRWKPQLAVCDLHPDYLSSKYVKNLNINYLQVQHHHAHIASCMAENGLDEPVIGISFDGTGLGDDGHIWGGEFFVCDFTDYQRISHLEYIPIPGGDKATKEPWRTAVSYLYHYFGEDLFDLNLDFYKTPGNEKIEMIIDLIKGKINCPLSSSAGRLFDAVSALLNICPESNFHAEAPMKLESVIDTNEEASYSYEKTDIISFKSTFSEIIKDINIGVSVSNISAKFHNTIIDLICETALDIREKYNLNKLALSGGSFQNKYILEKTENKLSQNGFEIYTQNKIPTNDGGIALGQLAIAAKKRELKLI